MPFRGMQIILYEPFKDTPMWACWTLRTVDRRTHGMLYRWLYLSAKELQVLPCWTPAVVQPCFHFPDARGFLQDCRALQRPEAMDAKAAPGQPNWRGDVQNDHDTHVHVHKERYQTKFNIWEVFLCSVRYHWPWVYKQQWHNLDEIRPSFCLPCSCWGQCEKQGKQKE